MLEMGLQRDRNSLGGSTSKLDAGPPKVFLDYGCAARDVEDAVPYDRNEDERSGSKTVREGRERSFDSASLRSG